MRFSINQSELQNALSVVLKGISTRSTLPILSGVYVRADNDVLVLQSTDLELSIQYTVAALIEEPGETVVPGKLFSEIVKNLPDAAVQVEGSEESAEITCDTAAFTIKTLNPQDFPGFPTVNVDQSVELPFSRFSSMVKRVARMVSKDESRAILTGVLVTLEGSTLRMVATDSYRLALSEAAVPDEMSGEFSAVISGSFLQDIAALPRTDETLTLSLSENQILVRCGDTVFVNRRIEGRFPNYRQLLPESCTTSATVEVKRLVSAVKRASLLANAAAPVKLDLNAGSQTLQLTCTAQDVGSTSETLPCAIEGDDMEIAFNYSYLIDGLNIMSTETVRFEALAPVKPGIFTAEEEGERYLYLVMPVRIS